MIIIDDYNEIDELWHYGTPRHSGRYPWGSGKDPYQRTGDFLSRVDELKKKGLGDTDIAKEMGLTTTQFRTMRSIANAERRALDVSKAKELRDKGYSLNQIAKEMGFKNDSSVRSLLNQDAEYRMKKAEQTAEFLKKQIDEKGMIDVGTGIERELGVSREKLNEALTLLEMQGYPVYGGGVPQATNPGQQTNLKVVCPPGTEHKEIYNYDQIHQITEYTSRDDGETFETFKYPASMDSKRLQIVYGDEGGLAKDGVMEIRKGVPDLSLGEAHYAQVRILVDGDKYLKGMAIYSDDLPDGVDIRFNTNKPSGTPVDSVLKSIKNDPDNPFGAYIPAKGQSYWTDENGKEHLSLINKTREEGEWKEWSDRLPSQFLSKQSLDLAGKSLNLAIADKESEFKDILAYTNPTIKREMLKTFAEECDYAAVHLQAAALPRQKYQVILPLSTIKDTEVYAPNYRDGEKVALIRYPHGGTFEIPVLTVNNKQAEGRSILGANPADAIGISSKVAERLSGADFDGDTVMVIPTNSRTKITSKPPLEGLQGFDPKMQYGYSEKKTDSEGNTHYYRNGQEFKPMRNTQNEMGRISNLITDMTIKGAGADELAKAVRHSMVVIDAEKHGLDYKQSERDNDIAALRSRWQGTIDPETGKYHEGASTIISRAKSETPAPKTKGSPHINLKGKPDYDPSKPEGALIYKLDDKATYVDPKTGKTVTRTTKSTKMAETQDARTLISDADQPMERLYANYANKMKSMANQARKEQVTTGNLTYSPTARKVYDKEWKSLDAKLKLSEQNAPKERKAQLIANSVCKAKFQADKSLTKKERKKIAQQELERARAKVGAKRQPIDITDREWEAIQAGAISDSQMTRIIKYVPSEKLKERATPRNRPAVSDAKIAKIQAMRASGYTNDEIGKAVGLSASTVSKYMNQG